MSHRGGQRNWRGDDLQLGCRKITFTGSTEVGRAHQAEADTIKKLSLELGGNAPLSSLTTLISTPRSREQLFQVPQRRQTWCANRIYVKPAL